MRTWALTAPLLVLILVALLGALAGWTGWGPAQSSFFLCAMLANLSGLGLGLAALWRASPLHVFLRLVIGALQVFAFVAAALMAGA